VRTRTYRLECDICKSTFSRAPVAPTDYGIGLELRRLARMKGWVRCKAHGKWFDFCPKGTRELTSDTRAAHREMPDLVGKVLVSPEEARREARKEHARRR